MTEGALAMLQRHPFVEEFSRSMSRSSRRWQPEFASTAIRSFSRRRRVFDFYLIESGLVALEIAAPDHTFRVQTLSAGDERRWSAFLMARGKHFQAPGLERVEALAFDGGDLLAACKSDPAFGFIFMHPLLGVVAERL